MVGAVVAPQMGLPFGAVAGRRECGRGAAEEAKRMGMGESYIASAQKAAEKRLGEPVLQAAFGSRSGAMRTLAVSRLVGVGGMAPGDKIHRPGGKDTTLPLNFLIVVTARQVHVYKHKMFWGRTSIKKDLGTFERTGLLVDVGDTTVRQFQIAQPEPPQVMAFEMARIGKRAAAAIDSLVVLLQTPPG